MTAWIGVIFFSSTSLAGQWAEQFFHFLSGMFLNRMAPESSSYDVIHLLADKGFHVSLFFVLAILLWRALPNSPAKAAAILIVGAAVGSGSEFLQRFFPDRDPAIRDVFINIAGTAMGLGVRVAAVRIQARQRRPANREQV